MKRVILTAGIGKSEKENKPERLAKRLDIPYSIFRWQETMEDQVDKLITKHTSYGNFFSNKLKEWLYDYASDATLYEPNKHKIFKLMKEMLNQVEEEEIILIANSWGCVVFYDFLKEVGDPRVKTLITTGCPMPLAKGEDYGNIEGVQWINYWEGSDPIANKVLRDGVSDREFKNFNPISGWNPLAHIGYFKSKALAKKIKKDIDSEK